MSLTLAMLGAALLAGCANSTEGVADVDAGSSMSSSVIIMADGGVGHYHPGRISVAGGGSVTWTNRSGVVHNVVFPDTSIAPSALMNNNTTHTVVFPEPGTYAYVCTLHPTMTGVVDVS